MSPEDPHNTASGKPAAEVPPDPLIGTTLAGRYAIDGKLGEGGMGTVYLATHVTLEKQVALKVLHGEFSRKEDLVERFLQEARAASRIRHDNVIDITDFGTTDEGLVFFAMELLQGVDLHDEVARAKLAQRVLPWARSRDIFLQVCSALAAAHAQGIIHRDLKPENIYLVERLGQQDFVKLLDFGIAKLTEVNDDGRRLTRTGMLFGTPEYMSPEQARGEQVDHRVDVYAMGCILYQLVTGRVPFEADNFMGVLSKHLSDPVPDLGPEESAAAGAPAGLGAVVHRALAKDRDERFATMEELAAAVVAVDGGAEGEQVAPAAPRRRRTQWTGSVKLPEKETPAPAPSPRRSPARYALVALALIAAAAAAVAVWLDRRGAGAGVSAAEAPGPERITLSLTSRPAGASVIDTSTGELLGETPLSYELPGGSEARRFLIKLDGHQNKLLELVPEQDLDYEVELAAVAEGAAPAEPELEVMPRKPRSPAAGERQKSQPSRSRQEPAVDERPSPSDGRPASHTAPSDDTEGDERPAEAEDREGKADEPKPGAEGAKPEADSPAGDEAAGDEAAGDESAETESERESKAKPDSSDPVDDPQLKDPFAP